MRRRGRERSRAGEAKPSLSFFLSCSSSSLSPHLHTPPHLQLRGVERGREVVEPAGGHGLLDEGLGVHGERGGVEEFLMREIAAKRRKNEGKKTRSHLSVFSTAKKKSIAIRLAPVPRLFQPFPLSFLLVSTRASRSLLHSPPPKNSALKTMTVEEPRRDPSWRMRPAAAAGGDSAAATPESAAAPPLVVSFPAGFHPPVSGWETYEGGPAGQQLLVVARAVRENGMRRERKRKRESIELALPTFLRPFSNPDPPHARLFLPRLPRHPTPKKKNSKQGTDADFVGAAPKASTKKANGKSSSSSAPSFAIASVDRATGEISYSRLATAGGPLRLAPRARRMSHDWVGGDDGALALPSPASTSKGGGEAASASAPASAAAAKAAKEAASLAAAAADGDDAAAAAAASLAERADRAATAGAKRALVAAFGSEKSRKKLAAAARGAIDGDGDAALGGGAAAAGVGALLSRAAADAVAAGTPRDAAAAAAAASRAVTLPRHHPNARTVHEAYVLDELVPAGALNALEAAADRLVVAATAVKTEAAEEVKKENGEAVASPSSPSSPSAAATIEEFPACVLSRAAALLRKEKNETQGGEATTSLRRSLRALALLAAALRLRRASRSLRVDPAKGGYESLGKRLGIAPDLLRPLLEGGDYASAATATAGPSSSPSSSLALNFSRGGLPERKLASLTLVLSLVACDGDLSPAAFEALRSELRASSRELAGSFREVGARASPVSRSKGGKGDEEDENDDDEAKEEEGPRSPSAAAAASPLSSPAGKPHRRYAVKLLVAEKEGTELGACFPALKLGRR